VRCPRAELRPAPGRFRASVSRHYRPGREVLAGLGQVKAGNARKNCARFCPGKGIVTGSALIPSPRKHGLKSHLRMEYSSGQNRGGTPTGERARSGGAAQADLSVARPAPAGADSSHLRLSAFRFLRFFLSFFRHCERSEAIQCKTRVSAAMRQKRRSRGTRPYGKSVL
jgi:hypothetical protein